MDRSDDGAQRGDCGAAPAPGYSHWGDLSPVFQSERSEGWKRRFLLKLRKAAYDRLRAPAPRKQQA